MKTKKDNTLIANLLTFESWAEQADQGMCEQ